MKTDKTARKVTFAAGGAGLGAAAVQVLVYVIEALAHIDIPAEVESAAVVLASALLAYFIGRQAEPHERDQIVF